MKFNRLLTRCLALIVILCMLIPAFLTACSAADNEGKNVLEASVKPLSEKPSESAVTSAPTKAPTQAPTAVPTAVVTKIPTPEPTEYQWPEDFSLYKAYEGDFLLGTIYSEASLSGDDKELTLKHFNTITPENIMKPEYMQPAQGKFNYKNSDVMVKFAKENGLNLIGHTLAWHQQTGNWLGRNVSRDDAIKQLKSHITNIVGNYKGKFASWDVVNEAINDGVSLPKDGDWTKCLRQTQWLTSIGPDYLEMAFQFAREADPDLKLYYNDYNLNNKSKADIVYAMVKDFKKRGIPIDGIGMQGHYNTDTSAGSVEYSLNRFSQLGVEVSITELDLCFKGAAASGLTKEQEITQGIAYAKLFQLFRKYKDTIARVTFWGYVDNRSWRRESFPCLFHADYTPKQAAYAVLDPDLYLKLYEGNAGNKGAVTAKTAEAGYGTPVIDAEVDDVWKNCVPAQINNAIMAWEGAKGTVRILWDDAFIYTLTEVKDSVLNCKSANAYEQDSIELYLDQNNGKTSYYEADDGQYRVNYEGTITFGGVPEKAGFAAKAKKTKDGYLIEMAIPLLQKAKEGMTMGFEAQINDSNANEMRQSITKFNDLTDNSYQSTEGWGNIKLVK